MCVTEKGQVTIPKHIRDKAGIRPGTDVDFRLEDGKVVVFKRPVEESVRRKRAREIRDYLERVRGTSPNIAKAAPKIVVRTTPYSIYGQAGRSLPAAVPLGPESGKP